MANVSKSQWGVGAGPIDLESTERLFFTEHEWETIEAATARIYPTDEDPGAREACVVFFIDRYIQGVDHIFATADGSAFLKIEGKMAESWRQRIDDMQNLYREGIKELDTLAQEHQGGLFKDLDDEQQDYVLELLAHGPRPERLVPGETDATGSFLQAWNDDGLSFFDAMCLHTRMGMFGDPVYGGNRDRVGWKLADFPGPASLKDTMTGEYNLRDLFCNDAVWEDLIPHLRDPMPPAADEH
jgi:gluconate 2-dehydrogenase gamma chain